MYNFINYQKKMYVNKTMVGLLFIAHMYGIFELWNIPRIECEEVCLRHSKRMWKSYMMHSVCLVRQQTFIWESQCLLPLNKQFKRKSSINNCSNVENQSIHWIVWNCEINYDSSNFWQSSNFNWFVLKSR